MLQVEKGIWAVLPAYNEEKSIAAVIHELKSAGFLVLVVDDGSLDKTKQLALTAGADKVYSHQRNIGYEQAIRTGLIAAAQIEGCRWCVTVDADGQFEVDDVVAIANSAIERDAVAVIGIRSSIPRLSETIVRWMVGSVTGLSDPLCGLKCFKADFIREYSRDAGRALNMYLAARAIGICPKRIVQLPVKLYQRSFGTSVFSRNFKGGGKILLGGFEVFLFGLFVKMRTARNTEKNQ